MPIHNSPDPIAKLAFDTLERCEGRGIVPLPQEATACEKGAERVPNAIGKLLGNLPATGEIVERLVIVILAEASRRSVKEPMDRFVRTV